MRAALLLAATAVTANARPIWRADRAVMPALAASPADAKNTARARAPQTYTPALANPTPDVPPERVQESVERARTLRDDPASRARLEDANREDLRLYEWVKADWMPRQRERFDRPEEPATSPPGALSDLRLALARLHRNLIYKPLLGLARRNAG